MAIDGIGREIWLICWTELIGELVVFAASSSSASLTSFTAAALNAKIAVRKDIFCSSRRKAPIRDMKQITLRVNGRHHAVTADPDTPLLFVLNDDLGLRGPRFGCGMAQCGACTVIIAGQVVRSCVTPVSAVGIKEITTLEGLGTVERPHPLQQAFIDEGAAQCGFCLSGVILTAKAVLDGKPDASDEEIRKAFGGVLCRCFTHTRMLRAIRKYAEAKKHHAVSP
jgi:nicotinate dehydrogenase subunit A